jgi:hypothetical protein
VTPGVLDGWPSAAMPVLSLRRLSGAPLSGIDKGLAYQLLLLGDVVETPSDLSDHRSFPVARAWPENFFWTSLENCFTSLLRAT